MRTILFRGKRKDNGEWVEGYFGIKGETAREAEKYFIMQTTLSADCEQSYFTDIEVVPESVGQLTGFKDASGKEIYEGDILRNKKGVGYIGQYEAEVVFTNGKISAVGFVEFPPHIFQSCKIIGNIHDNPKLLSIRRATK